jgi:hypothetical protein
MATFIASQLTITAGVLVMLVFGVFAYIISPAVYLAVRPPESVCMVSDSAAHDTISYLYCRRFTGGLQFYLRPSRRA